VSGVILAAISSVFWGGSDFIAGVAARRIDALKTSIWAVIGAGMVLIVAVLIVPPEWSAQVVWVGVIAGVCSAVGFVTLYASLALAPMGVATAILAASEAVVPLIIGVVWKGDVLGVIGWIGIGLAILGAVVVGASEGKSDDGPDHTGVRAVILAVVAGLAFGFAIVALDAAPQESGFLSVGLEMAATLILLLLLAGCVRLSPAIRSRAADLSLVGPSSLPRSGRWFGLLSGAVQGVANIVMMVALWNGQLSVVGAIICLYPLTTVFLARIILGEKLRPLQIAGIAVALIGCLLLARA